MKASSLEWYFHRLRMMSPQEVGWRAADYARQQAWRRNQVRQEVGQNSNRPPSFVPHPRFKAVLPAAALAEVPTASRDGTIAAADAILSGSWALLGMVRHDLEAPDWFLDPVTGIRAPQDAYSFSIDHRDVQVTGNVKQVWEL